MKANPPCCINQGSLENQDKENTHTHSHTINMDLLDWSNSGHLHAREAENPTVAQFTKLDTSAVSVGSSKAEAS